MDRSAYQTRLRSPWCPVLGTADTSHNKAFIHVTSIGSVLSSGWLLRCGGSFQNGQDLSRVAPWGGLYHGRYTFEVYYVEDSTNCRVSVVWIRRYAQQEKHLLGSWKGAEGESFGGRSDWPRNEIGVSYQLCKQYTVHNLNIPRLPFNSLPIHLHSHAFY